MYLGGKDNESSPDQYDHEEFARPDIWVDVPVTHRREGDNDKPQRVE